MLHALLLVALAQVAQPAAPQWGAAAPAASPNGIADFSAHGAGSLADIPPPNVDVDPTDYKPGDTAWVDRASGLSFAKSGSPAAWHGSPFYPDGFEEAQHYTVRPAAITDNYQHGTGSDALDVMGGGCIVTWVDSLLTTRGLAVNGNESTAGWRVQRNAGNFLFVLDGYSGTPVAQAAGVLGINLVCFGFTTTKAWILINGTTSAEVNVSGSYTPGTGDPLRLGRSLGLSGQDHGVAEFLYTSTPMSLSVLRSLSLAAMRCASGACIPEDAGTLTHVTFDASANAVDSKGLTWVKNGTPTALEVPYVWPGNRTPRSKPSVSLDGTNDWFTGPTNVPRSATGITVDCAFQPGTGASAGYTALIAEDDRSANRNWGFYATASSPYVRVYINGNATQLSASSPSPDLSWNVAAFSYDASGANGTGVLRINVNGVATTPLTNGATPINTTAAALTIGASNGVPFKGKHGGCQVRYGFAASAEQLDRIVRRRLGLLVLKPAPDVVSFARNDVHSACCPVTDASCFALGPNFPCITSRGLERAGPTSNLIIKSESFTIDGYPWASATGSAPTTTSGTWVAPNGSVGWTMEDTDAAVNQGLSAFFSTSPGTFVCSAWLKSITTSQVFWRAYVSGGTGHGVTSDFTLTPVPRRYEWSFTAGAGATAVGIQILIGTAVSGTSTGQIGLADFQCHTGTVSGQYRSTTGSVYSGPETMISIPDARRDFGRFAVLWTGTLDGWTPSVDYRVFWSYGSSDNANSVTAYLRLNTNINFFVYDAVPTGRTWNLYPGALADGQHSLLFDAKQGTFRALIDGVFEPGSGPLSGTGIPTASLPLNLCRAGTNTLSANCWIKRVVQATTERAAR